LRETAFKEKASEHKQENKQGKQRKFISGNQ
jgi:hypothetical protein